jgi:hypothetical protein
MVELMGYVVSMLIVLNPRIHSNGDKYHRQNSRDIDENMVNDFKDL